MTSDPADPDAVAMLQRMHARAVHSANHGEVPRISSAEVLAVLRATQAERARHAEEVAALRGQLGRFERARHDLDRLVQYVLENEDVENPSDVAALMSAGIVEHLLAVLNQEAPGD